jgi:hypothetical protein
MVRTVSILLLNSTGFSFEIITLASSANNIGVANLRIVVEKSFIYIRKNKTLKFDYSLTILKKQMPHLSVLMMT